MIIMEAIFSDYVIILILCGMVAGLVALVFIIVTLYRRNQIARILLGVILISFILVLALDELVQFFFAKALKLTGY